MRRVCRAIAGAEAIADEAVEAAWVVARKKLGTVHGPAQLRPWLVSVAANEVRHLLRKRRRLAEIEVSVSAAMEPSDDTTDRAQLHPPIVDRLAGAVYSPAVLRP